MVLAATLGIIVIATFMLGGWGWGFRKVFKLESGSWPATVALGMATLVFLGGILNLARLAYPPALAIVAAAGLLLSVAAAREISIPRPPWLIILLIAGITIFTIVTQLPPSVYNFRDDFQKYFAYPVRMLQTGTVFGSPLSAMGTQTLGAKPFLDGFVIAFFPIVYINAVDAVFGLFLCLLLASQVTQGRRDLLPITVLCVVSVVFIDPQYVNISTLYIGSALIMAMVALPMETVAPSAAAMGLLYAALVALKPTFVVFVAIHWLDIALSTGIKRAIRTGIASALFVSPWILLHAPYYVAGIRAHLPSPTVVPGTPEVDSINLFSFSPSEYGASPVCYTALIIAIGLCGFYCYRVARPASLKVVECCASGVVAFLVFIYVLGPIHAGYDHSMRYFTPIAIGLAPPAFGWTAYYAKRPWLPLLLVAIPLAGFSGMVRTRIGWAVHSHSVASYDWLALDKEYAVYNRRVLYGPEREEVKALQDRIPAGVPILTWTNTPFYFDYTRNRIFDTDTAGAGNPWAEIPKVRYMIWDYDGYATPDRSEFTGDALNVGAGERKNARRALDLVKTFRGFMDRGEVLFDDGEIAVVRLKDQ